MSFRKPFLFGAALILCCVPSLRAQFAVYGTITGERVGGFTCQDAQNRCASTDGKERPFGSTFGAYYDFRSLGPARLGVDVRGGVTNTNKSATEYGTSSNLVRHYSALAGARASFGTPFKAFRPYAEVLGGYARYRQAGVADDQFGQIQGVVGLDVSILPVLDFRAIELGDGELFGSGGHNFQSISAGVVFHF